MTANVLDGAALAKSIRVEMAREVEKWCADGKKRPGLAVILVGEDPASQVYVKGKERDCIEVGFHSIVENIPSNISQKELEEVVIGL
jgi:methylenetetrahydrofolate dehydrogenase (NADP+)/methenyltetrahydrofolate cyclohydrolase